MRKFYLVVATTSILLFAISLVAHLFAIFGIDLQDHVPFLMILYVLIFVLVIPMVAIETVKERREQNEPTTISSEPTVKAKKNKFSILDVRNLSNRALLAYCALAIYGGVNIAVFTFGAEGSPAKIEDKFVIEDKGTVVREISESDFDLARANRMRSYSSMWMAFYFYIFLASLAATKSNESSD